MTVAGRDVGGYYRDLTVQYGRYAGPARGWHYGLWEADVLSHQQALLRSNQILLRGLDTTSATRVLDVGCGVGGFVTWAAERHGGRLTGITLVAEHARMARDLARSRGVDQRCAFLVMDMGRLAFADRSFDVITNQETLCHAEDKRSYAASLGRILELGGYWSAVDFAVREEPLEAADKRLMEVVCRGFHIPALSTVSSVVGLFGESGFTNIEVDDLRAQVAPAARRIIRRCYPALLLMRLRLDWLLFSREPRARANRQEHVRAGLAYSRGLLAGQFRHIRYRARNG